MLTFELSSGDFGLVRMGKKRSIVSPIGMPSQFDWELTLTNGDTPRTIEAAVTRYTLTRACLLKQEDATLAGYLYLHKLQEDLAAIRVGELDPVTIIEFCCEYD